MRVLLEDRDGDGVPDGVAALAALHAAAEEQKEKRAELAQMETELKRARSAQFSLSRAMGRAFGAAFVFSFVYHLAVVRGLDQDPWLGLHHRLACPTVCETCRGPYLIFEWKSYSTAKSTNTSSVVYCPPSDDHFEGFKEVDFLKGLKPNAAYELPGGTLTLWASALALGCVVMLPVGVWRERRFVSESHERAVALSQRIEERRESLPDG